MCGSGRHDSGRGEQVGVQAQFDREGPVQRNEMRLWQRRGAQFRVEGRAQFREAVLPCPAEIDDRNVFEGLVHAALSATPSGRRMLRGKAYLLGLLPALDNGPVRPMKREERSE